MNAYVADLHEDHHQDNDADGTVYWHGELKDVEDWVPGRIVDRVINAGDTEDKRDHHDEAEECVDREGGNDGVWNSQTSITHLLGHVSG